VTAVPALTGPGGFCWIEHTGTGAGGGGLTGTVMLALDDPPALDAITVNTVVAVMVAVTTGPGPPGLGMVEAVHA
jgi:hypothetical protein